MWIVAASSGVAIAYTVAILVLIVIAPLITALKGHWLLFAAGWITLGMVWWIAALRLARPGSWWARRFYGDAKRLRSETRYGAPAG